MCRIDTGHLPLGTDLPVPRGQVGLHTGDSWGPDHKVQPGCTMVGAKGGRSLGIGPNGIQKRPARGHRRVRSMAPAGGRPGVQPGPSWVSCWVLGSLLPLGHGRGSTAARDWARQGGANRRRPRACRPCVDGVRSTQLRPGSPSPPERTHACGGLGVSRDMRHAGRTVAQAVRRHILPRKKHLGRRRFAPAQPGSEYSRFDGRRDGNAADTRPRAGEVFTGGRTVAPCPVQTGQWVIGHTQQLPGWRGVLGVALG